MNDFHSEVLATLADLIRINSINPAYEGGVPESAVAEYVERFFAARGVETFRQDVLPGRFNVIARVPGENPNRRVVLEAHMDTVSVEGMSIPPFDPVTRDGKMYGRGSCDTKAGLAAMMHAVAALAAEKIVPPCEVWLAAVVDEEHSFRGVLSLCEGLQAHAAIVAEPTELRTVVAAKGVLRGKIRTIGKAAHSSKPHLGVNAISHMAAVITVLNQEAAALTKTAHPLLGPASLNIGTIQGGEQVNFVPDRCEIAVDRRLLPGEDPEAVWMRYASMLKAMPELQVEVDPPMIADSALETSAGSDVVRTAQSVASDLGLNSDVIGVPFGSDASKLSRHGVPSIILGPGSIDRAHAAIEYVECDQVLAAASFYFQFLKRFE